MLAVSAAQAGGKGGMSGEFHGDRAQSQNGGHLHSDGGAAGGIGGECRGGANAVSSGQAQGQNGGHVHNDDGRGGISGDG